MSCVSQWTSCAHLSVRISRKSNSKAEPSVILKARFRSSVQEFDQSFLYHFAALLQLCYVAAVRYNLPGMNVF